MLDSPIVQVILGLVFVFALFSILVTQINTVISNLARLRARHLRDGIAQMIDDPELRAKVLTHPLVRLVQYNPVLPKQRLSEEEALKIANAKLNLVNYIEPKTFVNVLMNIVRTASDDEIYKRLLEALNQMPKGAERRRIAVAIVRSRKNNHNFEDLRSVISTLSNPAEQKLFNEAADIAEEIIERGGNAMSSDVSGLLAGLRKTKNEVFRTVMETVIATSSTLEEAEEQLQAWFNEGMSRAGDVFKRHMQLISIASAALLVLVMNVDAIHLARTLWNDPTLRAAVAVAARTTDLTALAGDILATPVPSTSTPLPESIPPTLESFVPTSESFVPTVPPADFSDFATATPVGFVEGIPTAEGGFMPETTEMVIVPPLELPTDIPLPSPTTDASSLVSVANSQDTTDKTVQDITNAVSAAQTTLNVISGLNLPLGWRFVNLSGVVRDVSTESFFNDNGNLWNLLPLGNPYWFSLLLTKLVGLIVTIIAISQGAPFWFDVLNRITRGK